MVFSVIMFVDALPMVSICTPVPYLPLMFQGVSASDLPTKSISLIPTKDPGTNLFDLNQFNSYETSRFQQATPSAPLQSKKPSITQAITATVKC